MKRDRNKAYVQVTLLITIVFVSYDLAVKKKLLPYKEPQKWGSMIGNKAFFSYLLYVVDMG